MFKPFPAFSLTGCLCVRATEILYSLTLAEVRRQDAAGRPASLSTSFPARQHFERLTEARRSLALFQHHDGITGTARDHVVIDYGTRWAAPIAPLYFWPRFIKNPTEMGSRGGAKKEM